MQDLLTLARSLVPVALAAGEIERHYYHAGAEVIDKADGSPVTLADQEAEKLILEGLARIAPDIPVVGEESVAAGRIPDISAGTFFLVDPLDGTREFIAGGGDFTVNIALLQDFVPVMGVIYAPISGALYYAAGSEAFSAASGTESKISVRPQPEEGMTVVASRRHGDPERLNEFLAGKKVSQLINRSSSLKFCVLAEGAADFYPRLGPTSEWDTAAGEAILRAAGGRVTQLDGKPLVYGKAKKNFVNPEFLAFAA